MRHFNTPLATPHRGMLLASLAVLGLAGCVAYPVYEQQPPTHASTDSRFPDARPYPDESRRDYRRRHQERLYEAEVTSVRAVVGPGGGQRCWIEREQVQQQQRAPANLPGAVVGGLIGGILGHQIGGGSGRDIATVGGAVAGAAVGANAGRHNRGPQTQDVQRCTSASHNQPDHWDVGYHFRGVQHRVQMTSPPGRTILVNGDGEPRI
jgi:uncharacterized protein YcfJ